MRNSGFTLVEILVVLVLLIFIASFAMVVSFDSYRAYNFRSEQSLLLSTLLKARGQAVANINQKPHGVYIDQTNWQYVLFQGQTYATRDVDADVVISGNSSYSLGGDNSAVFTQLSGTSTVVSIFLDDHIHPKAYFCVNSEGQINAKASCP